MRGFLVYLAEHADEEVTSHDAARAVDYQTGTRSRACLVLRNAAA
jgi:hypothetical protein